MKKLKQAVLILLACFATEAEAQQYYYYFSEKIYVEPVTEKFVVKTTPEKITSLAYYINEIGLFKVEKNNGANYLRITLNNASRKLEGEKFLERLKTDIRVISLGAVVNHMGNLIGINNKVAVKLKPGVSEAQLLEKIKNYSYTQLQKNPYEEQKYYILLNKQSELTPLEIANALYETGLFFFSEPDFVMFDLVSTNDANFNDQWGIKNTGQLGGTPGNDINVEPAWNITLGRPEIRVAVPDEGVDFTHPDLDANLTAGFDATGGGSGGGCRPQDSHGTSCSGIIAAEQDNTIGITGIAPRCTIVPIRIFIGGTGATSDMADGVNWAWNNGAADVISNSWRSAMAAQITTAVNNATTNGRGGLGCVVVFAAGNQNSVINFPATLNNVTAVGAMSMCNERKRSCSSSSCVNPGVSTDPNGVSCDGEDHWGSNFGAELDVAAPGVKITTTDNVGIDGIDPSDYDFSFNGTSSACPHAAGVMALILSVNRCLSWQDAKDILEATCTKAGTFCYLPTAGHPNGTWNQEVGHGRINAFEAVKMAASSEITSFANLTGTDQGASSNFTWVLTANGCTSLSAGTFIVKRHEVNTTVTYNFTPNPFIIGNSNGLSAANPNTGAFMLLTSSVTETSAVLKTFVYEVINGSGQTIGWVPRQPGDIRFNATVYSQHQENQNFQNQTMVIGTNATFKLLDEIKSGFSVDPMQTFGNYVIDPGATITFHAGNHVLLATGFRALNGSDFTAIASRFFTCTQYPNGMVSEVEDQQRPDMRPGNLFRDPQRPATINDAGELPGFKVYPNPTNDLVTVEYKGTLDAKVQVVIYDIVGKTISSSEVMNAIEFKWNKSLSNLAPGTYVVCLTENGIPVRKELLVKK